MKKFRKVILQAAREAGGKITDNLGKDLKLEKSFIVASNGKIHSKMLLVIN